MYFEVTEVTPSCPDLTPGPFRACSGTFWTLTPLISQAHLGSAFGTYYDCDHGQMYNHNSGCVLPKHMLPGPPDSHLTMTSVWFWWVLLL